MNTVRDTVNTGIATFNKIAPSLLETIANHIDKVAEKRIQQAITQERKEVERVTRNIIVNCRTVEL